MTQEPLLLRVLSARLVVPLVMACTAMPYSHLQQQNAATHRIVTRRTPTKSKTSFPMNCSYASRPRAVKRPSMWGTRWSIITAVHTYIISEPYKPLQYSNAEISARISKLDQLRVFLLFYPLTHRRKGLNMALMKSRLPNPGQKKTPRGFYTKWGLIRGCWEDIPLGGVTTINEKEEAKTLEHREGFEPPCNGFAIRDLSHSVTCALFLSGL